MKLKDYANLAKESVKEWSQDKASRLAAALAFYTMLSLAPLLVIAVAIAAIVFGQEAAQGEITKQISNLIGEQSAGAVQSVLQNARHPGGGTLATVIGVATLLLGASGVFAQLQDALNTIWEVQPKPGQGIMAMVEDRFFSFTMVVGVGFLLLVSLIISTALATFGQFLSVSFPVSETFWQITNGVVAFVVVTVLFAVVFKVVPDIQVAWSDIRVGAVVTAVLFTVGRFAIGLYLGRGTFFNAYGAAGSLVVVLMWVYYSAQILFVGAEFTQVYANHYGSGFKPDAKAIPVTEEQRAQEGIPRMRSSAQNKPQDKNRQIRAVSGQRNEKNKPEETRPTGTDATQPPVERQK